MSTPIDKLFIDWNERRYTYVLSQAIKLLGQHH